MSTLRIATFNIRHGAGADGRLDLDRTARAIDALGADAVGLQEVDVAYGDRSADEDQAARLGEMLGMQACFGAAIDRAPAAPGGPRRRYGTALLTRGRIVEHTVHPLPARPALGPLHEPRAVLATQVLLEGLPPLHVLVTHLDNDHRGHRTAQVLRILELAAGIEGPVVLLGDMNSTPDSPEQSPLAASGWRDAGREAAGGASRPALMNTVAALARLAPPSLRATHPARFPVRRIDAVWLRGAIEARDLTVAPGLASDHRPVVSTLALG